MGSYKQPNYSRITTWAIVENLENSLDFYTKAFGFDILEKHERDGVINGATLKLGDMTFMLFKCGSHGDTKTPKQSGVKPGFGAYVYYDDVDKVYNNAIKHGAVSLAEPQDSFWGDRYCQLRDPDGYEWGLATYQQQSQAG